ncbi:hypothetical protein EUGRSUZ_C04252 [Eucalyptus grandis]|uniref:Uncharacterized protein n=2 Tax=Eucalyptus grandis TaxID=71139 RepID=A0ACC3LKS0_EUCGR|nr:hypothetical protein EUGRSUZ_C04252 [Eucalyptus grandis]
MSCSSPWPLSLLLLAAMATISMSLHNVCSRFELTATLELGADGDGLITRSHGCLNLEFVAMAVTSLTSR